jgi:molybdopterin-guanine dinucleotide biosynthesis protein A
VVAPDGFVLAGGRSRRMGSDKARAPWGELPLAIATASALRAVCGRVALIRRRLDGLPWLYEDGTPAEVVLEEVSAEEHPLWGVYTALTAAQTEIVLLAPCDVPALSAEALRALLSSAPSVASDGQRLHPLVAALPRSWAARARDLARQGAPAHHLARDATPVPLSEPELADHDDPESLGPSPVQRLLAQVPISDPEIRARIAQGELGRLRARGIVDPREGR